LPQGFNRRLICSYNNLTELILTEGFNNILYCYNNKITELILPEGFNSELNCFNNNLTELILPETPPRRDLIAIYIVIKRLEFINGMSG